MDSLIIFNVILCVCWCGKKKVSSIIGNATSLAQWLLKQFPSVYMCVCMYTLHIILTVWRHPQIQIILKLIDFSLLLGGNTGSMWRHEPIEWGIENILYEILVGLPCFYLVSVNHSIYSVFKYNSFAVTLSKTVRSNQLCSEYP